MALNITGIKTASDGILQGDNALHTAFPLLIIQTTLILVVTRLLAFAFKPLRQPKVIAEIVVRINLYDIYCVGHVVRFVSNYLRLQVPNDLCL